MDKVCAVIAAYNEEKYVGSVVRKIISYGVPVFLVDDGSNDSTRDLARKEGATVFSHDKNYGKGKALRKGFSAATRGGYEYIVMIDADGQHDPAEMDKLLSVAKKEKNAIITGTRMGNISSMPKVRRYFNRIAARWISKICGQDIPDPLCGYRVIPRRILDDIVLLTEGFNVVSEMLIEASKKGYRIVSVGIATIYADEKSHIRPFRDGIRLIKLILGELRKK